ncbi:hypothetical protein B566_EDAN010270 [Ephemera danica]|nr:hypothetical protein B566_EDAN010270 [Ephemera danica]
MSASNGGMRNDGETFFSSQPPFPELTADGKLDTVQFLESAAGVVSLVDLFGKTFAPVKSDMGGNVEKLTKQYNKDKIQNVTLHDMVISEKKAGENFATEALLWLKRALHFFQVFLRCVVHDAKEGKHSENLAPFLKQAYSTTLEKYHGWMAQQLFSLISRMCPYRKDLLLTMSNGHTGRDDAVFRDLEPFIDSIERIIAIIDKLYLEQGLDLEVKA